VSDGTNEGITGMAQSLATMIAKPSGEAPSGGG
jgi:hypothetical protein